MTSTRLISTSPKLPIGIVREVRSMPRPSLGATAIGGGLLAFVAAAALMFSISWQIAIPSLIGASIVIVLIANRAISAGLVVDDEAGAPQRLLANEQEYAPMPISEVLRGFSTSH